MSERDVERLNVSHVETEGEGEEGEKDTKFLRMDLWCGGKQNIEFKTYLE